MTDLKRLDNIGSLCRTPPAPMPSTTTCSASLMNNPAWRRRASRPSWAMSPSTSSRPTVRAARIARPPPTNPVGLDHLAFEVEDFEAAHRNLEAQDITFIHAVVGEPGGFRYRGFHDPDGNVIYGIEQGG